MDNQHRKIAGYRELSQEEIDLMNRIKAKGAELLELQEEAHRRLVSYSSKWSPEQSPEESRAAKADFDRFHAAEPFRWAAIARTDIQTGVMALVRAIAQPVGV